MDVKRCPGQDTAQWTPDDIFEIGCPKCGASIEFYKDDKRRRCSGCGEVTVNPKMDIGCAAWCSAADKCSSMRGYAPKKD